MKNLILASLLSFSAVQASPSDLAPPAPPVAEASCSTGTCSVARSSNFVVGQPVRNVFRAVDRVRPVRRVVRGFRTRRPVRKLFRGVVRGVARPFARSRSCSTCQ